MKIIEQSCSLIEKRKKFNEIGERWNVLLGWVNFWKSSSRLQLLNYEMNETRTNNPIESLHSTMSKTVLLSNNIMIFMIEKFNYSINFTIASNIMWEVIMGKIVGVDY